MASSPSPTAQAVNNHAFELSSAEVLERIPTEAVWVLIGEGSHGTKEFYETRAIITKDLIERRGFNAVAVEADFPDAFRANLWVRDLSEEDSSADEALSDFKRFPTWMWRNKTVVTFLDWLHDRNRRLPQAEQRLHSAGFYGLDVYSLNSSMQTVISYLERVDPDAAKTAKQRYSCFDRFGADAMMYGLALRQGYRSCEAGAIKELTDMRRVVTARRKESQGQLGEEEWDFAAVENARIVKDAEHYYRAMFFRDDISWNIRDRHMVHSAESLHNHLKKRGIKQPKIVIWAHNSHLGDARATDMGKARGEVNIGELIRERFAADNPDTVVNIGLTTHAGTVTAADDWDEPAKHKRVNPSLADSYENLMHSVGKGAFGLDFKHAEGPKPGLRDMLKGPRLERAIGVIYRPDTERWSHYFKAWLPQQFDMLLHIDITTGVEPLEPSDLWHDRKEERHEPPETYPFAL